MPNTTSIKEKLTFLIETFLTATSGLRSEPPAFLNLKCSFYFISHLIPTLLL